MRVKREIPYPTWLNLKVTEDQRKEIEKLADEFEISLSESGRWLITAGLRELRSEKIM